MPKYKKTKPYTLYVIHIPVIILAIVFLGVSVLTSTTVTKKVMESETVLGSKANPGNGNKQDKTTGKPDKATKSNNSNKPDFTGGNVGLDTKGSNSRKYKESITQVVEELEEVAQEEEEVGNTEVSDEIEEVADTEEETVDEVTEAINSVESRSKWQTLLFGSDYKNLGQLRSSLAHNTNSIRKLTRASGSVQGEGSGVMVQNQLETLVQERQRIMNVITENESQFSLLGWVVKLLTGYDATPIGGIDDDVVDEAEDVIDSGTGPDETVPSDTTPTDTTPSNTSPGDSNGGGSEPAGAEPSGTNESDTTPELTL